MMIEGGSVIWRKMRDMGGGLNMRRICRLMLVWMASDKKYITAVGVALI